VVIAAHRAASHFYTDDSQLYISSPVAYSEVMVNQLMACVVEVSNWMCYVWS